MKGRRKKTPFPASSGETATNTITADAPEWLSAHGKLVWQQTVADLETEGRPLGKLNREAFIGFCESASMVKESGEVIAREGYTIDGGREGQKRHPATSTRISALASLRAYAIELGLTPGTAGRISKPAKKQVNPFDEFV